MIVSVAGHSRRGIAYRPKSVLRLGAKPGGHLSVVHTIPAAPNSLDAHRVRSEQLGRAQLTTLDDALGRAERCVRAAYDEHQPWPVRVRAALSALLELFEEDPELAELCVVQSATFPPGAVALREQILAGLARVIDEGRDPARRQQPPPLTARGVVAGTIGAVRARLQQPDPQPLIELLNPLMSFIVLPYRGAGAARRESSRRVPSPRRARQAGA